MWLKLNGHFGATKATNAQPQPAFKEPEQLPEIVWLPTLVDTSNVLHFVQNEVGTRVVYNDGMAPQQTFMFPLTVKETATEIFDMIKAGGG